MSNLQSVHTLEGKITKKIIFFINLKVEKNLNLQVHFIPAGDQPDCNKQLKDGLITGQKNQVLLGVTGSGKTFTMAKIIEELNRPALILAPNKTLAAQLYGEMKSFFQE